MLIVRNLNGVLDSRIVLILGLVTTLFYGHYALGWNLYGSHIGMTIGICILTQTLFCIVFKIPANAMLSALTTAFILCLGTYTPYDFIAGITIFFAVSSKYIFHYKNKPIFNPANFGIVFMVLFTQQITFSSYPMDWVVATLIILSSIAAIGMSQPKKLDVIFVYIALMLCWQFTVNHWHWSEIIYSLQQAMPLPLLLFTFVILANPITSPNSRWARLIWTLGIVGGIIFLQGHLPYPQTPYFVLFFMSLTTPIFDKLFANESRFAWDSIRHRTLYTNAIG